MSHQARDHRHAGGIARLAPLVLGLVALWGLTPVQGQPPTTPSVAPAPTPTPAPAAPLAPEVVAAPIYAPLPPDVQLVRFHGPQGLQVEVMAPAPEGIFPGEGSGQLTVGLKVGVGYRLRLSNLPDLPGAELYPVIEVVGHLHRPPAIDPFKFPIRVVFRSEDLVDAVQRGQLVTQVVYLEDPDQALPLTLPKDMTPVVTLEPGEDSLKVATALGRVMAILRIGGRMPGLDELNQPPGLVADMGGGCPFTRPGGGRCPLPCGLARGTAPPPGRPWLPKDEYLCDGGDREMPLHFGGTGSLAGVDPRDALIQFYDGVAARPRVLPTNVVCIYAPRFATVRSLLGPNLALTIQVPQGAELLQRHAATGLTQGPRPIVQNRAAELYRHRSRASGASNSAFVGEHFELRVLGGYDIVTALNKEVLVQVPMQARNRQKPLLARENVLPLAIKTAEGPVVTGIVQGANQAIMAWKPEEEVGVEVPPDRTGLAVVKRVSSPVAEPGDIVTFSIQYRNMGNVPIASVSVIDSLLPRLAYVPHSALGPAGSVFSAGLNQAGSTELRWDLPGVLAPGAEGYVSFQAEVR